MVSHKLSHNVPIIALFNSLIILGYRSSIIDQFPLSHEKATIIYTNICKNINKILISVKYASSVRLLN